MWVIVFCFDCFVPFVQLDEGGTMHEGESRWGRVENFQGGEMTILIEFD